MDRILAHREPQTADAWKPAHAVSDLQVLFVKPPPIQRRLPPLDRRCASPKSAEVRTCHWGRPQGPGYHQRHRGSRLSAGGGLRSAQGEHPQNQLASANSPTTDAWQGREQEAIDSVKNFRISNTMFPRCPLKLEDVCDGLSEQPKLRGAGVRSWPKVATIAEVFDCSRFLNAWMMARIVIETQTQQGQSRDEVVSQWSSECHSNPEILRRSVHVVEVVWSATRESGPRYRARAVVHDKGLFVSGNVADQETTYAWLVDLAARTLKHKFWDLDGDRS